MKRADKTNLQSLLNCDFRGVLARDLGPMSQAPLGAKAGGRLFEHAFIARLRPGAKAGIYRRKTKKRFPVKSVSVPIFEEAAEILSGLAGNKAKTIFEKRFLHELKRVTGAI
jgi:hypothetical protein